MQRPLLVSAVVAGLLCACPARQSDLPRDAGVPEEVCNGVDDDQDGTVDLLADGGALTRLCELQEGICRGALSRCASGTWAPCAFAEDWQATETRCDGVDNDCDGLVDEQADVTLLEAARDGGRLDLGTAFAADYQVVETDAGFVLALADHLAFFDVSLRSTGLVSVPRPGPAWSYGITASGLSRVRLEHDAGTCAVLEHLTLGDAGALVPVALASACWPNADTNWFVPEFGRDSVELIALGMDLGAQPVMAWATLREDGGSSAGLPNLTDAGVVLHPGSAGNMPRAERVDSRFLVFFEFGAWPGTQALWVEPSTGLIGLHESSGYDLNAVARREPLVWFRWGRSEKDHAWINADGGLRHGPEAGLPALPTRRGPEDLGVTYEADSDGGRFIVPLSSVGATTTRLERLPNRGPTRFSALDEQRVLASWPEGDCTGMADPIHCPTARIVAHPICLPPLKE